MYTKKRMWLDRDKKAKKEWKTLMETAGLNTQEEIDYTIGIYDEKKLVATGSYADNVIKCMAVCKDYQSENFLTELIVHLMEKLEEDEVYHYFVYTDPKKTIYFESLGFKPIVQTKEVMFMEFGSPNFTDYLTFLNKYQKEGQNGAVVVNANPFTKGHRHLVEETSKKADHVYVFVLSEDRSEFSTEDRINMVKLGTEDLKNVAVLPTEDYMVSAATFPSYFLRDDAKEELARIQATVDAQLFKEKIAHTLHLKYRFVGEEPYSKVTDIYNESMKAVFREELELVIIPRRKIAGETVSATKVRQLIHEGKLEDIQPFVPQTTYKYIKDKKLLKGD